MQLSLQNDVKLSSDVSPLPLYKFREDTAICDKLFIAAFLRDTALIKYEYSVTVPYGRKSVRDDYAGTAHFVECAADLPLGEVVECARGFIENKYLRFTYYLWLGYSVKCFFSE